MSRLRIFDAQHGDAPLREQTDPDRIAKALGEVGVRYERWQAAAPVTPGDPPEKVIAAYRHDIDRLQREHGYRAVDVISLDAAHPQKEMLRQKFLNEHTHAEDEVRFFVAGSGLFTLHIGDRVYEMLCTQGDLIGVPDGTRHWFDMGPNPGFVAIRLFTNPEGWVAQFTGDAIAQRFPRLEN
ncbi:MAG: acireductone dioxygenase [Proteobacteria bacterium]|nr:acireductone dioxygenase [Pseudomonadota bacterium]